jgi:hypothetical protein
MTVWALLEECTGQLDEPFRRSEIVGWFRRHHPEVNEATLGAHIQAATENGSQSGCKQSAGREARSAALACSYDTAAATVATPGTASAVDHLMTRSAAFTTHHRRPARIRP